MSGQQAPPIAPPITPGTALTWQPHRAACTGPWEPWVNVQDSSPPSITPLGASGRVPTIIVSPWTFKAGLSSQVAPEAKFDHSSVIQYLEELTGVPCANLPDQPPLNWRRETFSSLTTLIPAGNQRASRAEVLGQLPSYEQVDGWRTDLLTRLFGPNPAYPPTFLNTDGSWQGPPVILPNPAPDPVQTWPPLRQTCDAVADKATFGLDDVRVAAAAGGDPGGTAPFPSALWVILDGFDAAELNLGTLAQKTGYPPLTPAVKLSVASGAAPKGISWTVGPAEATELMPENVPQRFRFPVDITFTTDDQGNYPAFSGVTPESPASITVQVSFTSHLTWNAPALELELVVTDGPFIQTGAVPYLSTDLRAYAVYTDGRGPDLFGVPYRRSQAPTSYVQQVIAALNSSPAQQAAFAAAQPDDDQAAVSTVTSLPDLDGRPVANFAIARITMQGPSQSAYNVRVFFRLFPALSKTSTAFNPATLYRSTPLTTPAAPDPSGSQPDTVTSPNPNAPKSEFQPGYPWLTRVPLLGLDGPNAPGTEVVTLPFFAVERVTPDQAMYEQPPDWPNTQTINIPSGTTGPVYAFFGCWLDINQPDVPQFPASVPADGQADGPFTASVRPASSITSLIRSQHLCLVAEIAYDEITIPPGVTPGTSDRLAQRNLSVIGGES